MLFELPTKTESEGDLIPGEGGEIGFKSVCLLLSPLTASIKNIG